MTKTKIRWQKIIKSLFSLFYSVNMLKRVYFCIAAWLTKVMRLARMNTLFTGALKVGRQPTFKSLGCQDVNVMRESVYTCIFSNFLWQGHLAPANLVPCKQACGAAIFFPGSAPAPENLTAPARLPIKGVSHETNFCKLLTETLSQKKAQFMINNAFWLVN